MEKFILFVEEDYGYESVIPIEAESKDDIILEILLAQELAKNNNKRYFSVFNNEFTTSTNYEAYITILTIPEWFTHHYQGAK
jgi:hypothetical protein